VRASLATGHLSAVVALLLDRGLVKGVLLVLGLASVGTSLGRSASGGGLGRGSLGSDGRSLRQRGLVVERSEAVAHFYMSGAYQMRGECG